MRAAWGVDIGGTSIKIGLVDEGGNLVLRRETRTRTEEGGRRILSDIAEIIAEENISLYDILGIGLAVPGPVAEDGRINRCLNLGWDRVDAGAELKSLTGWPVQVGNDGSMAAVGEMWKGSARGFLDFVMVTLGTGIGGGVVIHGRPLIGRGGSAGEIGHILVNPDESQPCVCGNYGCMEQYASARALAERTLDRLRSHPEEKTLLCPQGLTAREVAMAAQAGDPLGIRMLDLAAEALGRGLGILGTIIDPQLFVIGGGMSQAGEVLLRRVREAYKRHAFHAAVGTPFSQAELGNDAAIYGCARTVLFPG